MSLAAVSVFSAAAVLAGCGNDRKKDDKKDASRCSRGGVLFSVSFVTQGSAFLFRFFPADDESVLSLQLA